MPRIGIQMNSEGCFPGAEARRAIVDALERKTPKAINWRATRAGSVCWLALVSRIPDMYFVDTFPREVADWKRTIHVPAVWQRVLFWPFPETEGPKAEIITGRTGDGQCRSDSWGRFPSSRVLLQNSSPPCSALPPTRGRRRFGTPEAREPTQGRRGWSPLRALLDHRVASTIHTPSSTTPYTTAVIPTIMSMPPTIA